MQIKNDVFTFIWSEIDCVHQEIPLFWPVII